MISFIILRPPTHLRHANFIKKKQSRIAKAELSQKNLDKKQIEEEILILQQKMEKDELANRIVMFALDEWGGDTLY